MSSLSKKMKARRVSDMTTAQLLRRAKAYQSARPRYTAPPRYARSSDELKGVDTSLSLTPVIATTSTNACSFTLNLVQAGNGSWNRVGRKISLQSLRVRATFSHAYALTATTNNNFGNSVRMVVVWDKQPSSGSVPTFDTIFGRTAQDGTESCLFLDALRYDNSERFSVLRDKVIDMPIQSTTPVAGTGNQVTNFYSCDEFIPLKGAITVFSGQSSPMTIADISSGALYVFFRTQLDTPVTNVVSVDADSFARLRYKDN